MVNDILKTHICAECEAPLVERWNSETSQREIKCGKVKSHVGFKSYKLDNSHTERRTREMSQALIIPNDIKGMIARIEQAKFPEALKPEEKQALAVAAITYGLDPLMGELSIYQGRVYVTIDGRYRKAQENKEFDGMGETRPATKEERAAWNIPDGDYFFRAEAYKKGISRPFIGWGRVRLAEINPNGKFKPIDLNPQRMCEKRAEAQSMRKGFHLPLPSLEEVGTLDGAFETTAVDLDTGEILGSAPKQPAPAPATVKVENTTETEKGPPEGQQGAKVSDKAIEAQKNEILRLGKLVGYRSDNQVIVAVCGKNKRDEWKDVLAGEAAQFITYLKDVAVKQGKKPQEIDEDLPF